MYPPHEDDHYGDNKPSNYNYHFHLQKQVGSYHYHNNYYYHFHDDTNEVQGGRYLPPPSRVVGLTFPVNKPTVRVCTKADPSYSLAIREGKVILARSDTNDPVQKWIRDERYSELRDEEGFPSFALVNKATGQALKHSIISLPAAPVQLTKYDPGKLDGSILWTLGCDLGDGYRQFRTASNIKMKVDACRAVKEFGGVHDGTIIILMEWNGGDNQKWKIVHQ